MDTGSADGSCETGTCTLACAVVHDGAGRLVSNILLHVGLQGNIAKGL